ncbi:circadian clock protein KaiB [Niastella koreensis]|uniref:KaiB domain protein n=2 Tax=Niastella koreensis TaxID=354356 RepID=G8TFS3_NIAKG|nr:circadian clock KaiB family protein [Niastella koreensis]AEV99512.1 KaiB domain protein [Niastella koreensis GR20-10]OQP50104.1 circadian clock protein KaiB [Niastella koreensis]
MGKKQPSLPDTTGATVHAAYVFRLYVTGASPNSSRAIINIKEICEIYLKDRYTLEIIDVYQQPMLAKSEQIVALPLLVKVSPAPTRKLIGDLADKEKVLKTLGLK